MENIVLHEDYIDGVETAGKFGFPVIKPCYLKPDEAVPFSRARKELRPKNKAIHTFEYDKEFEHLYNDPGKYLDIIKNFKCFIGPDYSVYLDSPFPIQIYNQYRSLALTCWLQNHGVEVIPSVGWTDESSYEWIWDGIPKGGTVAVGTNGCHNEFSMSYFHKGFQAMLKTLDPSAIIMVGEPIKVDYPGELVHIKSKGQIMKASE